LSVIGNSNQTSGRINVAVRPERINFLEPSQRMHHIYTGVVEEKVYLGNVIKYKILVDGKESLVLTENNDQRAKNYRHGESVLIGWDDVDVNVV